MTLGVARVLRSRLKTLGGQSHKEPGAGGFQRVYLAAVCGAGKNHAAALREFLSAPDNEVPRKLTSRDARLSVVGVKLRAIAMMDHGNLKPSPPFDPAMVAERLESLRGVVSEERIIGPSEDDDAEFSPPERIEQNIYL